MKNSKNIIPMPVWICLVFAFLLVYHNICYCQEDDLQQTADASRQAEDANGYPELLEKYKEIKLDRDNLLIQAVNLLKFKREYEGRLEGLDRSKEENKALTEENAALGERVASQDSEIMELREDAERLAGENEKLSELAGKSKVKEAVDEVTKEKNAEIKEIRKQFKEEIAAFKNEIKALKKEQKTAGKQRESDRKSGEKRLKKILKSYEEAERTKQENEAAIARLRAEVAGLEYEKKQNKDEIASLKREAGQVPSKFKKLAAHNKALTRQVADMHYNQGVFFCEENKYVRAVKEFRQVLDIRPFDKDAVYNLGLIYAEQDVDREKALYYLKRYIQLDNTSVNAEWAKKYIMKWETWRKDAGDIVR